MKQAEIVSAFERFLASVPLERYRNELLQVKTIEQDLPPELNPLPAIYNAFWVEEPRSFPDYEVFFERWWQDHLEPLDGFIRKYFWGCSHEFVFLGFKARLYRTLISVLTQFHFAYMWRAYCDLPLESSAELDMKGIDGLTRCKGATVALQVKKETYRAEARRGGRFAFRRRYADWAVEIPYTITSRDELQRILGRSRRPETRERYELLLMLAERWQRSLENGFVVFQQEYPRLVERLIHQRVRDGKNEDVQWDETLRLLRGMSI